MQWQVCKNWRYCRCTNASHIVASCTRTLQLQIDINLEMGMPAVSNQFFLETRFITLYNDAFRNWEFNIEVICKDLTLLFTS